MGDPTRLQVQGSVYDFRTPPPRGTVVIGGPVPVKLESGTHRGTPTGTLWETRPGRTTTRVSFGVLGPSSSRAHILTPTSHGTTLRVLYRRRPSRSVSVRHARSPRSVRVDRPGLFGRTLQRRETLTDYSKRRERFNLLSPRSIS